MAVPMRNTFQFYDRLMRSGLTEDQARVIIEAIEDLGEVDFKEFATKADLATLATKFDLMKYATKADLDELKVKLENFASKDELKEEISAFRAEVKADSASMKADILDLKVSMAKLITSVNWMQRMFMGCILVIALGVIQGLTHFI